MEPRTPRPGRRASARPRANAAKQGSRNKASEKGDPIDPIDPIDPTDPTDPTNSTNSTNSTGRTSRANRTNQTRATQAHPTNQADRSGDKRKQRHRRRRYASRYASGQLKIGQTELEAMLVKEHNIRASAAKRIMRSIREKMARALLEGHEVGITGVGTIQPIVLKGRVYKSPQDGSIRSSGPSHGLRIRPAPGLLEDMNHQEEKGGKGAKASKAGKNDTRTIQIKASRLLVRRMNKNNPPES